MGSAQKAGWNQQELLAGKPVHVKKKGKKREKLHNSSSRQKKDYSAEYFRLLNKKHL